MTINTLVIEETALTIIDSALIEEKWFDDFEIPLNSAGLKKIVKNGIVYLLSNQSDLNSKYLVVNIGENGALSKVKSKRNAFDRIIRVALKHFIRNISIPIQWQPYWTGSKLSIYSSPLIKHDKSRIYFDSCPLGTENIYAYGSSQDPVNVEQVTLCETTYREAANYFEEVVLEAIDVSDAPASVAGGNFGIVLNQPLGASFSNGSTLDDWYSRLLTKQQLKFVDESVKKPIRLRGAAGTGKTQSMVVKLLKELYSDLSSDKTFAFLAHSSSLAHEVIKGMLFALDPTEQWAKLKTSSGKPRLWIGTLYELAQEHLNYLKKGIHPLSTDGRDGKELQADLIDSAFKLVSKEPRFAISYRDVLTDFNKRIEDSSIAAFISELMNEFACAIDSENVRNGTNEAEKYINSTRRDSWQMHLPTPEHRKFVLEIHEEYLKSLKKENFLSLDQMITDFGRYLSTHEWNQLRDRDGFDVIFVDEYHYFNRMEAVTFHGLFKSNAEFEGRWPLIMAYDLKQSPSDAAIGSGINKFRNPGVGESTAVELNEVFRSTPEIVSFLTDIDGSFPSMDLEGEFNTYKVTSKKSSGEPSVLLEFQNDNKLIDYVFDAAVRELKSFPRTDKKRVAVLCMNEFIFDKYRRAGKIQDKIVSVTSREDLKELSYATNKCIFSLPEYVAGLQFESVYIIHADQVDLEIEYITPGARRRYVSRLYLGASRAVNKLYIASSKERGGSSSLLEAPLRNESLIRQPI